MDKLLTNLQRMPESTSVDGMKFDEQNIEVESSTKTVNQPPVRER